MNSSRISSQTNVQANSRREAEDPALESFICPVQVVHARLSPVRHEFTYSHLLHQIDLSQLSSLQGRSRLWGYNRLRPFSIYDEDYLQRGPEPLTTKISTLLERLGYTEPLGRVTLLTAPRYMGVRVFNPVSFYFCRATDDSLRYFVAEINNTYYERYVYVVDCKTRSGSVIRDIQQKQFHVSPFFSLDYQYEFNFSDIDERLDVRINLIRDGSVAFMSRVYSSGAVIPVSTRTHLQAICRAPFTPFLTTPRIYWQAIQLFLRRRLPVLQKPIPRLPNTVRVDPIAWLDQACVWFGRRVLQRMSRGALTVIWPDGEKSSFGAPSQEVSPEKRAEVHIHSFKVFRRLVLDGGLGFGEAYVAGEWSTPHLSRVLEVVLDNWTAIDEKHFNLAAPFRWFHVLMHRLRGNTLKGSRRNISAHYDLSNKLFALFLDPTMTYSCAYYQAVTDSLEQAQHNKINKILRKATIRAQDHVLEIGSGWGSLALKAAEQGCQVTSVTVSREQLALAEQRVKSVGLQDKVRFELRDYRTLDGQYDKIVSVEMLEAVGHEHLPEFFKSCERVLKPDGVMVIQVITQPDQGYEGYRRRTDFIQKHIFPGSHIPSLSAIADAVEKYSNFVIESVENIGPHYARTLREWSQKFESASAELESLGYDERFKRLWRFYLSSCEAQFATRWLNVAQIVLTRPNNRSLVDADAQLLKHSSGLESAL